MIRKIFVSFFLLATLMTPVSGQATTSRFSAFDLWPALSERSYFFALGSENILPFQYHIGLSHSFAYHPLQQRILPVGEIRSIVDYDIAHFLSMDLGVTDAAQIGFSIPFFSRARFREPSGDSPGPEPMTVTRVGDLRLNLKVQLRDLREKRLGFAIAPFLTIPLGADDRYLGETSFTGGFSGIAESRIGSRVRLALNVGLNFRGKRSISTISTFSIWCLATLGCLRIWGKG